MGIAQGGLFGGDDAAQVQAFIAQTGVTFPVGFDVDSSYQAFPNNPSEEAISPFPLDVVIDREGRIAYLSRDYDADALRQAVEQALAQ